MFYESNVGIRETSLILREGPFKSIIYSYINTCPTGSVWGRGRAQMLSPLGFARYLRQKGQQIGIDAKLLVLYSALICSLAFSEKNIEIEEMTFQRRHGSTFWVKNWQILGSHQNGHWLRKTQKKNAKRCNIERPTKPLMTFAFYSNFDPQVKILIKTCLQNTVFRFYQRGKNI